jgi:hypothetical protein
VDHNVVYNVTVPININWEPKKGPQNIWLLNNVGITDGVKRAGLETGAKSSEGSIIHNNIWSNGIWAGGWNGGLTVPLEKAVLSHNILASDDLFVDARNQNLALRNYQLKNTANTAINQGLSVPPYDDKLVGPPDIGAYEAGVTAWTVGAGRMPTAK